MPGSQGRDAKPASLPSETVAVAKCRRPLLSAKSRRLGVTPRMTVQCSSEPTIAAVPGRAKCSLST